MKKLGLVALATLALGALFAVSATASMPLKEFRANSYPAKFTGTQEGPTIITTGRSRGCNTSISGEITGPTKVTNVVLTGYCEEFGVKHQIKMNGCSLQLNPSWNSAGIPSGCGPITLQFGVCTTTFPAQDLFASFAGNQISVDTKQLQYNECGTQSNSGSLKVTWKLSGVSVAEIPGEASVFAAQRYPATITGSQEAPHVIGTQGGEIECEGASFAGSLGEASSSLSLAPTFSGACRAFGFVKASIATNGCSFTYGLNETGDPYPMGVSCPAGKSIVVTASTCVVSIPAQSGRTAVDYENLDSTPASSPSKIRILSKVTNLTYNVITDGFLCPFTGTGTRSDGTYTGSTLLTGKDAEGRPVNIKIGA